MKRKSCGRSPFERESLLPKRARLKKGNVPQLLKSERFERTLELVQGGFCSFQHLDHLLDMIQEGRVGCAKRVGI